MNHSPPASHPLTEAVGSRIESKIIFSANEQCLRELPFCCPFLIRHSTWEADTFFDHSHQSMTTMEIVIEGCMYYELEGISYRLHANQMILLPVGSNNRIRNGSNEPARKIVIGVHGALSEIILAHYRLFGGKIYDLETISPIIAKIEEFSELYKEENISERLPEITGKSFELIYLIKTLLRSGDPAENLLQMIQIIDHCDN